MKRDYIPRPNGNLILWLTTYKANIATTGALLGLSAGEITALENACQRMIDSLNAHDLAKQALQQQSQATNLEKKTGLTLVRRESQRMKNHSGYTNALGESIRIIGDEHVVDIPNSKPILKITKIPSGRQLDFNLLGFFDSVHIYKKRPTDVDFSFLANDTSSPYIDTATAEVGTRYYAYYIDSDIEVGLRSDEVVIS